MSKRNLSKWASSNSERGRSSPGFIHKLADIFGSHWFLPTPTSPAPLTFDGTSPTPSYAGRLYQAPDSNAVWAKRLTVG